jgi:hypothetical protein
MKIQNNQILGILFTTCLGLFIIWNRFIRIRLPKDFIVQESLNRFTIMIILFFFLCLLIHLYYVLKYFQIIPRPNSKLSLLIKKFDEKYGKRKLVISIITFINDTIIQGPANTYDLFYQHVTVKTYLQYIGAKLSYHFVDNPDILYILCFVIPRLLPWHILLLELICYHHIKYFYTSLILLLIPLLSKILFYMIKHHAMRAIDYYNHFYDFVRRDDVLHIYFKELTDIQEKEYQESMSSFVGDSWEFFQYLYNISAQMKIREERYKYILYAYLYGLMSLDFLIQSLLLLGWYPEMITFIPKEDNPFSGYYDINLLL